MLDGRQLALLSIGRWLREQDYRFIAITPDSHRRVRDRTVVANSVRDIFGWNLPFRASSLPKEIIDWLQAADAVTREGDLLLSKVRFATLDGAVFVHSSFPTTSSDAVFFGPDTYRFVRYLHACAPRARRVVDIGCGSGAGGLCLAKNVEEILLTDINPAALSLAQVNAELNGVLARVLSSDVMKSVAGDVDLIIANPPYLVDAQARVYRNGGGALGAGLSLRVVDESLSRLSSGGRLLLYTASAIVDGHDAFREQVAQMLHGRAWRYEEIDPDVFGEELDTDAYRTVERIAVIGLDVRM